MINKNIEELQPNPNNEHTLTEEGKRLLLHAMSLGDHGIFLITPEGLIINGNNRWYLRNEAHWDNKIVFCRVLTWGQDAEGLYGIIDNEIVKDGEVITHHYVSLDALYAAYAFTANGEAGYYKKDMMGKFEQWQLDPNKFSGSFFSPASFAENMKKFRIHEKKKKYEIVINCNDEADMDEKYQQVLQLGYQAKRKI